MADQGRWFKLWCTAPYDDDLQRLPVALRWAWVAFGVYTKVHGTGGSVTVSPTNTALAGAMGVPPGQPLLETLAQLPHIVLGTATVRWPHGHDKNPVCEGGEFIWGRYPLSGRGSHPLEEWCRRDGSITVTWRNWSKYQSDSTGAQRMKALRSKRRRDKDKEETKKLPLLIPPQDESVRPIPESIQEALRATKILNAVTQLWSINFWKANIRSTNGHVEYAQEILKAEAWLTANPTRAPRKDLARFMHNWLARAGERL